MIWYPADIYGTPVTETLGFSFVSSPTDTHNTGADPHSSAVWNPLKIF